MPKLSFVTELDLNVEQVFAAKLPPWEFQGAGWEFRGAGWEFWGAGWEFRGAGLAAKLPPWEFWCWLYFGLEPLSSQIKKTESGGWLETTGGVGAILHSLLRMITIITHTNSWLERCLLVTREHTIYINYKCTDWLPEEPWLPPTPAPTGARSCCWGCALLLVYLHRLEVDRER
jgi:hypothetical protein